MAFSLARRRNVVAKNNSGARAHDGRLFFEELEWRTPEQVVSPLYGARTWWIRDYIAPTASLSPELMLSKLKRQLKTAFSAQW